ncbi:phage antirepressor KilAC domain-containing protein [Pantoea ananatis]|uniref:phage antirepressor KilAC domain-containing protein n=1 Tax=Pantoea ananas TaxID=553 RepID=UPI000D5F8358|nr:phage antirepressor KilAC domain-containing protein [Pantoea ananatis]PVY82798.1 phage antirepressor YoqD-like protein [Pantoea ananatis]
MNIIHQGTSPLKMTSREISTLVGKTHRHVMRDIEVMLGQLGERPEGYARFWTHPQNGQTYREYVLDRDHTECLITGYSAILRMKVIKRIRELESASALPANYPQALRHAADMAEKTIKLQSQLADDAPKIDFAERVADITKGVSIPNYAKAVGLGPVKLFEWMRGQGILISGGQRHNLPMQRFIDRGYFAVRQSVYDAHGEKRASFTTMLSGKGEQWLTKKLLDSGMFRVGKADAK